MSFFRLTTVGSNRTEQQLTLASFDDGTSFSNRPCIRLLSEKPPAERKTLSVSLIWKRMLKTPSFFVGNKGPTGLPDISRGKAIQQKLPNDLQKTYLFSLFDAEMNTPFYSAYKVTPSQVKNLGNVKRWPVKANNWRNPPGACE